MSTKFSMYMNENMLTNSEDLLFWEPGNNDLKLISISIDKEISKAGSLTMSVPYSHPLVNKIHKIRTRFYIKINDSDYAFFCGRVYDMKKTFYNAVEVIVEGNLSYLLDTRVRPYSFKKVTDYLTDNKMGSFPKDQTPSIPARLLLWYYIAKHNANCGNDAKKFLFNSNIALVSGRSKYRYSSSGKIIGNNYILYNKEEDLDSFDMSEITSEDFSDSDENDDTKIAYKSSDYNTTIDEINSEFLGRSDVNGFFMTGYKISTRENILYFCVSEIGIPQDNPQPIEFGKNLKDFDSTRSAKDIFTSVIPLGVTYKTIEDYRKKGYNELKKNWNDKISEYNKLVSNNKKTASEAAKKKQASSKKTVANEKESMTNEIKARLKVSGISSAEKENLHRQQKIINQSHKAPKVTDMVTDMIYYTVTVHYETHGSSKRPVSFDYMGVILTGERYDPDFFENQKFPKCLNATDAKNIANASYINDNGKFVSWEDTNFKIPEHLDQNKKTTIASIPNLDFLTKWKVESSGNDYIDATKDVTGSTSAISEYGRIFVPKEFKIKFPKKYRKTFNWNTYRTKLINASKKWLKRNCKLSVTTNIKAFDLGLLDSSVDILDIGYSIQAKSNPHGLNNNGEYLICSAVSFNPMDPGNSDYTIGSVFKAFSDKIASVNEQSGKAYGLASDSYTL